MDKILILLLISVVAIYAIHSYNAKRSVDDRPAAPFEYSESGNYAQVTPMKHDVFKQFTIDITTALIITYIAGRGDEIFSLSNFHESVAGRSAIAAAGYFLYYQIIEPALTNVTPRF